jgi:ubiquinone/menaquinone biosynthesis C-methylase UbiE
MYTESYAYYDKLYADKDYAEETRYIVRTLEGGGIQKGSSLLDVACGTGEHVRHLARHYKVEGLDVSADLVRIAQEKNPGIVFHQGDMRSFLFPARYDAITCLFSSIGYLTTLHEVEMAVARMKRHLRPNGMLLVEPWFTPEQWIPGGVHMKVVEEEELKLVRMSTSMRAGNISSFDMHYLVGTPQGTRHMVERHRMGLYTREEMTSTFRNNRMEVQYDEKGPTGRGMYVARNL